MPYKSFAQMRKFKELVKEGKVSKDKAMEWWHNTNFKDLPGKVKHGKKTRQRN